jgi:LPS sulfotransferase NodH
MPFVIIFPARVGSTLLQTLLDSHPRIEARGEVFCSSAGLDADAQIAWLEGHWRGRGAFGPVLARGFKTKWSDIRDRDRFARVIRLRRARVIRMHRRNTIKAAVSLITGESRYRATGEWNRRQGQPPLTRLRIDAELLAENLRITELHHEEIRDYVEGLGVPTLSIAYEDLVLDQGPVLQKACRFLRVRSRQLASPVKKNTRDDLRKALANFDELRARYEGTRYAAMFDEVLLGDGD